MSDPKKQPKGGAGSILKLIGLLLVVALVAAFGYGMTLEAKPHFEQSVVIKADAEDIHERVGDLKKWDEWGPWRDEDPSIEYTYSEKTDQVGSHMSWTMKDGKGSLKIDKLDPEKGMWYTFQWEDYEPNSGYVSYTKLEDGNTKVTWAMDANDAGMNVLERYMWHFGRETMEKMFRDGLTKLKTQVEEK